MAIRSAKSRVSRSGIIVPGWEAPFSVKYLKNIKIVDQPYHAWNEAMNHSVARPDIGGKSRWYHFAFGPKSVITRPSAGIEMRRGYVQITGIAWSGGGKITKTEISVDGGKNWREAKLQDPIHPRRTRASPSTGNGTDKRR